MIGAIAGDIIGSIYEHNPIKTEEFPLFQPNSRFTDDTVMSVAAARAILQDRNYGLEMKILGQLFPDAGYGGNFRKWLFEKEIIPYNSWGNGSAMRVSPVGFSFNSIEDVLREARASAEVSHDHPEGIKGAQAVALAILMARLHTGQFDVISLRNGYHGGSQATMGLTAMGRASTTLSRMWEGSSGSRSFSFVKNMFSM